MSSMLAHMLRKFRMSIHS